MAVLYFMKLNGIEFKAELLTLTILDVLKFILVSEPSSQKFLSWGGQKFYFKNWKKFNDYF